MSRTIILPALLLVTAPRTALGDEASEAQLQFELGAEMYRQRKYPQALERFLASNRLVPNANVVFNVAQTYQLMRRPVEAYNWFEEHLSFPLDDERRREGAAARDRLAARVAVVDVTSDPPGARIFVDRIELGATGRTPRRIAVVPGDHAIILQLDGWRENSQRVIARQGEVAPLSATLEQIVGLVEIDSSPPGATIRLEGRDERLGTTPARLSLPVGDVRLCVSLEGHVEQTRGVLVRNGATAQVRVELARAASTVATLTVRGRPRGALVRLDGRPIGRLPFTRTGLAPGSGRLEVVAAGHEGWETDIVLEAGAATRARARLVDPGERPWDGWLWTGLGSGAALLAAGLAVGAVALSQRAELDANPTRDRYDDVQTLNLVADVVGGSGLAILGTTLLVDLLSGPRLESHGQVTIAR